MVNCSTLILKKEHLFSLFYAQKSWQQFNCDSEGISPPVAGALGTLIANEVITSILNLKSYLNGNILIMMP